LISARGQPTETERRRWIEWVDVLAADLRRGGNRFGQENRTAPAGSDSLYGYCDALPSVRAQLAEFESQGHITHVADPGVHGSSMLGGTSRG
ncbi:MAG: hypothetical protein ACI9W4_001193, partial [Rhodothermales bacterium]